MQDYRCFNIKIVSFRNRLLGNLAHSPAQSAGDRIVPEHDRGNGNRIRRVAVHPENVEQNVQDDDVQGQARQTDGIELEKTDDFCIPILRVPDEITKRPSVIPQKVVDKIFQPFFTTKPTGQGTGLGLSLSYDIIKAHGGEIKVETKEGAGSEFIIQLSISNTL